MSADPNYNFCPTPESVFPLPIPSIPYIPNSLKCDVHNLFFFLFHKFNTAFTERRRSFALCCILATGKLVLRKNGRHEPRNRSRRSVHALIRARILLALQGKWLQLYEEATEAFGNTYIPPTAPPNAIRRCKRAMNSGAVGKPAQALLTTDPPTRPTRTNAAILRRLHPDPVNPVNRIPAGSLPPSYKVNEAEVRREIRFFPFHSSPGPDGLRPSHIKAIPHAPGGAEPSRSALAQLTIFCNNMISGKLPLRLSPYAASGLLLGIPKTDPSKLRPIAVGLVLRRLVCRLLMAATLRDPAIDIRSYFLPHQLAVGTKGGTEAVVHAVRHALQVLPSEHIVLVMVDAVNAFNAIERSIIMQQVIQKTPGLARWVHYAYGVPSILLFGTHVILSKTGTQQGDPLSMLLFSLALQPLIEALKETFQDLILCAFFADDGTIILKPNQAAHVLKYLRDHGERYGFNVSLTKSKIWCPNPLHPNLSWDIPPSYKTTSRSSVTILGVPVGSQHACTTEIINRANQVGVIWDNLTRLRDPQKAFHIMRFCASACKMIYLLRCTPPQFTSPGATLFDSGMRRAFQKIHRPLTDEAWQFATLPIRLGGLGLSLTSQMCEAAYVSSIILNVTLIRGLLPSIPFNPITVAEPYLQALHQSYQLPISLLPAAIQSRAHATAATFKFQQEISTAINNDLAKQAMPSHSDSSDLAKQVRARLRSVVTTNASRVISVLPQSYKETFIEPEVWCTITDKRLGNPLYSGSSICFKCEHEGKTRLLDVYGYHAAVCPAQEGTIRRHNNFRDKLYSVLAAPAFGLQVFREWYFPQDSHLPRQMQRRMDIIVDDLSFAPCRQAFDVTIISPHADTYNHVSLQDMFEVAEKRKVHKYKKLCDELKMDLHTIAVDVYGAISRKAENALQLIANYLARKRGTDPADERNQLLTQLTIWVNKYTAVAINRRMLDNRTPT